MTPAKSIKLIQDELVAIRCKGDYSRRIANRAGCPFPELVTVLNDVLSEVEAREKESQIKLDELMDTRDDAQTANAMLRHVKVELKSRSDQLDKALARSKAASEAKSQFLANVSHEIRTPMNGILGMAELLLRMNLGERPEKLAKTIVESGRALLTIINDVLDFSKIESGVIEFDPKPFNLRMCVEDVAALLRSQAQKKGIELRLEIDPALPEMLVGDPARIRQILINLIGNALKFTDEGYVAVSVQCALSEQSCKTKVTVRDTGIGIPATKIDEVFQKFSQVDNTSTRRHEGTGLGLTIFSQLIEKMGGTRGVTSELGSGSTFWFELDLLRHQECPDREKTTVDMKDCRVLLVQREPGQDDHVELQPLLTAIGCQTTMLDHRAENAVQTTGCSESAQTFDLILLTTSWVDAGILREIETLRSGDSFGSTPVIVLACHGSKGDARSVEDAGAQGYLPLPISTDVLQASIESAVGSTKDGVCKFITRHSIEQDGANTVSGEASSDVPSETEARPSRKVLLVEDSFVNQEVAREFLEDIVDDVQIANNGKEAVEMFQAQDFDLILMDCQMPEMDGFQATRAIRTLEEQSQGNPIPIVALTANAFASDKENCLAAGMSDFLSKPFVPEDFESIVCKWLSTHGSSNR